MRQPVRQGWLGGTAQRGHISWDLWNIFRSVLEARHPEPSEVLRHVDRTVATERQGLPPGITEAELRSTFSKAGKAQGGSTVLTLGPKVPPEAHRASLGQMRDELKFPCGTCQDLFDSGKDVYSYVFYCSLAGFGDEDHAAFRS